MTADHPDAAASHWTSWPPMDDGPVLTDEEQMALVTAVRVQQVARIITRDTGAPEDAAMTAAWSLARVGLLATPWRGDTRPEPPVTADHTPERLSAEEREALADSAFKSIGCNGYGVHRVIDAGMFTTTERILAAHLADVEARLAAVEALCDEADEVPPLHSMIPRGCVRVSEVRAVLHPDPSGPVVGLETSGSWDQAPRRHPDPSEAI